MTYVYRRVLQLIPLLIGVSLLIFLLTRAAGIDAALMTLGQDATDEQLAQFRRIHGLDRSWPVQYGQWLTQILRGDFGESFRYGNPVIEELAARFPATLALALSGVAITLIVGVPAGIFSALAQKDWPDYLLMVGSLVGVSTPVFLLGFLLIWFLSYKLPIFPTAGSGTVMHLVLPALAVGLPTAAVVTRLVRTSMLEVLRQDYIRTARSKGLSHWRVTVSHALRNALVPVVTIVGLQFGFLLNGSIIVEQVFAWPGIGSLIVNAASLGDFPVVQGAAMLFTIMFVMVNLGVDLLYGVIDPRVRLGDRRS